MADKVDNESKKADEEEEEVDPFYVILEKSGCVEYHYKLQDCFHDNNGEWKKCQSEMKEFQKCMNACIFVD